MPRPGETSPYPELPTLGAAGAAPRSVVQRVGLPLAWLLGAALVAFGTAGMVGGFNHFPATSARAELTWAADSIVTPAMDDAAANLQVLSVEVDRMGSEARQILVALVNRDATALNAAIAAGSALEASIVRESATLRGRLVTLVADEPHPELRIAALQITRHAVAERALGTLFGISDSWAKLTSAAPPAARVVALLQAHDTTMADAAAQGRARDYTQAQATISGAKAMLDEADRLRNTIAGTSDVSVLDQWLRRNRTYDDALDGLYAAVIASGGKTTAAVTSAAQLEVAARAQLPADTRGLDVIVAELSQGGLNQAAIAIEQAGTALSDALGAMPDS